MRGAQVQQYDGQEAVEQQVVDDTDDGADKNLAISDEDDGAFNPLLSRSFGSPPPLTTLFFGTKNKHANMPTHTTRFFK